jgi:hypothetical protein
MLWEITGTMNGRPIRAKIEANSEREAWDGAARKGVSVSSVAPFGQAQALVAAQSVQQPVVAVANPPPPGYPPIQIAVATPTQPAAKGTSGMGIASLVIAIIAILFCWIPFIGIVSIPIASISLLLGVIGFFISLVGGKSGVGMPVAGCITAVLAIVIAVAITGGTAAAIGKAAQQANNQLNATNQTTISPNGGRNVPPTNWAAANAPVRQGDLEIGVAKASVESVPLNTLGGGTGESKSPQLVITIELTNRSDSRKIDYRGWAGRDITLTRDFATITDDADNVYKRVNFGMDKAAGQVESTAIYPGKTVSDVLVFEPPVEKAKYLHLEMPASNFGGVGMIRIEIPSSMIERK